MHGTDKKESDRKVAVVGPTRRADQTEREKLENSKLVFFLVIKKTEYGSTSPSGSGSDPNGWPAAAPRCTALSRTHPSNFDYDVSFISHVPIPENFTILTGQIKYTCDVWKPLVNCNFQFFNTIIYMRTWHHY